MGFQRIAGAKMAPNPKKGGATLVVRHKRNSLDHFAFEHSFGMFWLRFWGVWARCSKILGWFFELPYFRLLLLGRTVLSMILVVILAKHVSGCSCWGSTPHPRHTRSWHGGAHLLLPLMCPYFSFWPDIRPMCTNLPKTKNRDQIRTDYYENPPTSQLRSPKSLANHNHPSSKRWAAVLPSGGLQLNNSLHKLAILVACIRSLLAGFMEFCLNTE